VQHQPDAEEDRGDPDLTSTRVIISPRRRRSSMNLVVIIAHVGTVDPRPSEEMVTAAAGGGWAVDTATATADHLLSAGPQVLAPPVLPV
jgi:hypothetical protein